MKTLIKYLLYLEKKNPHFSLGPLVSSDDKSKVYFYLVYFYFDFLFILFYVLLNSKAKN